ncbi:MAG TPA: hypothetical protein VF753_16100 [Terriglobales bacterium]
MHSRFRHYFSILLLVVATHVQILSAQSPATGSNSTARSASAVSSAATESIPDQVLDQLVKEVDLMKKKQLGAARQLVTSETTYLPYLVAPSATAQLFNAFQEQRLDVQVTSSQSAGSSTSTTNKGSVPWLFGAAVEAGALTQSTTNGQIVLRGNVTNAIAATKYQGYITSFDKVQEQNALVRNIAATSFSISFNPSNTTNSSASPAPQTNNFSGFSIHYDIWNHRDPRDRRWRRNWASTIVDLASASNSADAFLKAFEALPALRGALIETTPSFGSKGATYVSGGTVVGSTGQTCTLSKFDTVPGAEAVVALTEADAIGSGSPLKITKQGASATSAPSTATLSNGTATCSGTAAVTVPLQTPSNQWEALAEAQFDDLSASATDEEIRAVLKTLAEDLAAKVKTSPEAMSAAQSAVANLIQAGRKKTQTYTAIMQTPTISFEYSYVRQSTNQIPGSTSTTTMSAASPLPNLSTFDLIFNTYLVAGSQLSLNGVATIFNSLPVAARGGSMRDVEATAEVDIPLPQISNIGKPTLTFSGLYMDLINQPLGQPLLVNGIAESRTGNIGVFQGKFTIPLGKGSGVNVPVAFTYANRTELVKESDVRGSIGVTFNLDSLFSKP